MKGLCGIDFNKDRTYVCFAGMVKGNPILIEESDMDLPFNTQNLVQFLLDNGSSINKKICEKEKQLSLHIEKIYINLPWNLANSGKFSATIPLSKRKKVTFGDIALAKKYLQDTFLDWDDFCVHNFVLDYEIEGKKYNEQPIGVVAKKITVTSCLVWVKDKMRKEVDDILSNLERNFSGFVYPAASIATPISLKPKEHNNSCAIIDITYDKTFVVAVKDRSLFYVKDFPFGLKNIFDELERKILIPAVLAKEVFNRYISFKELPYFKEVSIKTGDSYINLSTQAANTFVQDCVRNELKSIAADMRNDLSAQSSIYFSGRLNQKEGFCDFVRSFLPYDVQMPNIKGGISNSFGCLAYGLFRPLEGGLHRKESILSRIGKIYKEYF